jgi:hypothetical protein
MTRINHVNLFALCSDDVTMNGAAVVDSSHIERIG